MAMLSNVKNKLISHAELVKLLKYDQETGKFSWLYSKYRQRVGDIAGTLRDNGYIQIGINRRLYRAHRLAIFYMTGSWPKDDEDVDHIDGNRANNSYTNLRVCSRSENMHNCQKHSDNTSGVKGIWLTKCSYVAEIYYSKRKYTKNFSITKLGEKKAFEEAMDWLHRMRETLHKDFANHG